MKTAAKTISGARTVLIVLAFLAFVSLGLPDGLLGVALVGFAIAPVFPGLISGTGERVTPRHAANTIGMQIGAAGLGVATLPGLVGVLAQQTSLEMIPVCLTLLAAALFGFYSLSLPHRMSPPEKRPCA